MGLSLYYDWKAKIDTASARRLIARCRAAALKLPFDKVSEIFEQDPPDGKPKYIFFDHPFRQGDLYLTRRRADGEQENLNVPALHAVFSNVHVQGAETASIGAAANGPERWQSRAGGWYPRIQPPGEVQ